MVEWIYDDVSLDRGQGRAANLAVHCLSMLHVPEIDHLHLDPVRLLQHLGSFQGMCDHLGVSHDRHIRSLLLDLRLPHRDEEVIRHLLLGHGE